MSSQTAQILGWILLALVITLVASKLISGYIFRSRAPQQRAPAEPRTRKPSRTLAALRFLRQRLPHLPHPKRGPQQKRRPRPSHAERRATREQNWRKYLESREGTAADEAVRQK
jgi:hypothetical protein